MSGEVLEPDRLDGFAHPRETTTLHGHGGAEQAILEALRSGKMPHAWLIAGPEGIGKATLAYRFARTVLAHGADGPTAGHPLPDGLTLDPEHPVARQVRAQSHPDLIILRRPWDEKAKRFKTALTVDEVRKLHGVFAHHASMGGWRVALIDAADDMNRSAANALLKLLEEPPPRALILLIAHRPARLLPTIRSRCRRLPLKALAEPDLAAVLADHGLSLDEADRMAALRLADGSAGRLLSLAAGEGLTLYGEVADLLTGLPKLDAQALHSFAGKVGARGAQTQFTLVADLLDRLMGRVIRHAAGLTPAPVRDGESEALSALAARRPLAQWIEAWDKIARSLAEGAALNLDRKQLLLTAFFTLQATARGA